MTANSATVTEKRNTETETRKIQEKKRKLQMTGSPEGQRWPDAEDWKFRWIGLRWIIHNRKSRRSKVIGCRRLEIQMDWLKMDYR